VIFPDGGLLPDGRAGAGAGSSIKAGPVIYGGVVDRGIINDGPVNIGVMYDRGVDIHYGGIIPEGAFVPFASYKSGASVPVAIVYASIKSDMHAPISRMPAVDTSCITPVAGCP